MGRHLAVGCLAQRASRPSRGPRAPPPPLGDGGPGERDRHREADRVDCVRIVHLSETCDDDTVHLITHAMTTVATVHEARCTAAIHEAMAGRGLVPATHLVDAAYVDAEFLVRSREDHGIELVGPPRPSPAWRGKARSRAATRPTGRGAGPLPAREAALGLEAVRRPGRGLRPGQLRRGRLRPLPPCTRPAPAPPPAAAPAGRARGAHGRPGTTRDQGGPAPLRPAGRDRGHLVPGCVCLRLAPRPLLRTGQDAPAARGDRGRDRPPAPRRLVPGGPARRHPHLPLCRPHHRLSRLRQQYLRVSDERGAPEIDGGGRTRTGSRNGRAESRVKERGCLPELRRWTWRTRAAGRVGVALGAQPGRRPARPDGDGRG